MSYYNLLGLEKEPFSTSPDPSFLFLSEGHRAALCRLQIAITQPRGRCVLLGDVGTGKTTLSRRLAQELRDEENVLLHMILNPYFQSERQFLSRLVTLFHIDLPERASALEHMEGIEQFLFKKGVEEGKTVVLLIDESQILPEFVLEQLRILLNYETNEYKMLQLVLVGQLELLPRISRMDNFWDRIAMKYMLKPLRPAEVRDLLNFRLEQAGYTGDEPLFTDAAIDAIWEHTRGYPRKLSQFCHNAMEGLVMYDRTTVDIGLVERLIEAELQPLTEDGEVEFEQAGIEV